MGLLHTTFACGALISGTFVIAAAKGTRRHLLVGRLYGICMLLLNVSALLVYNLSGHFGPFHFAALLSLLTLVAGLWPAYRRRPGWPVRHAYYMSWSYGGLLAAAAAEAASRVPGWDFLWSVIISSLLVLLGGGWVIARRVPAVVEGFLPPRPLR